MIKFSGPRVALTVVLAILLASIGVSAANATPVTPNAQAIVASQVDLGEFGAHISQYSLAASSSLDPQQLESVESTARAHAVAKGPVKLVASSMRVRVLNGSAIIVSYSLSGDNVDPASNLSVVFNAQQKYVTTEQVTYIADGAGGGTVTVWTNGVFSTAKSITAAQAAQVTATANANAQGGTLIAARTTSLYNKFSACLGRMGVPGWVLGLAAALCAASCAITLGAACVVCAVAIAVAYASVISYCAWYASTH